MAEPAPEPQLEFRPARASDVEAVVALIESAYRGDASRAGWTTEADLLGGQRTDPQEISSLLSDFRACLHLCWRGPQLLGCVLTRDQGDHGYIGMLAVSPRLQNGGIGRALLGEAERAIRTDYHHGIAHMTVIEQRQELIAWYERRGYRNTGRLEPFPYGQPRFGLPKRDDLRFVVLEKKLD